MCSKLILRLSRLILIKFCDFYAVISTYLFISYFLLNLCKIQLYKYTYMFHSIGFCYEEKVRSLPRKISQIKTLNFQIKKLIINSDSSITFISNVSQPRYRHNQTKNLCKITINTKRQDQYIKVSETRMTLKIHEWLSNGNFVFVNDSDPCQKAKREQSFSEKSSAW